MNHADMFEQPTGIYALSHSVGPLLKSASLALQTQYLDKWSTQGGNAWPHWLTQIDNFCHAIGEVIHAPSHLICPQVNLASGFYAFLTAIAKLPAHKHQSTIVMHQDAFASMGFVVSGLAKTFNFKLHLLEGSPNDLDAWYSAFEHHQVLACLITHVHSNTSEKSNVAELCRIAKQFEAFACVDVAQSIGIAMVDVIDWQADAIFGSCVKWLCGGPGAGFMYIKDTLLPALEPDPVGWFSHQNPFEFDIGHYQAAPDAKRFMGGTPSIAPFVMATAAINELIALGLDNVVTHNKNLKYIFCSTLPNTPIYEHLKQHYMNTGGSLCISTNDVAFTLENLNKYDVKYDCRGDVFRISLHLINIPDHAQLIARCFK